LMIQRVFKAYTRRSRRTLVEKKNQVTCIADGK
jgi:hypothetical protein